VSRGRCEDGFSLHASAVEQARGLHDVRGAVRLDVEASDGERRDGPRPSHGTRIGEVSAGNAFAPGDVSICA